MQTRAEKRTEIAAKVALQQRKQLEEIEPVTHRNVYCSWKKGGHSFGKKAKGSNAVKRNKLEREAVQEQHKVQHVIWQRLMTWARGTCSTAVTSQTMPPFGHLR